MVQWDSTMAWLFHWPTANRITSFSTIDRMVLPSACICIHLNVCTLFYRRIIPISLAFIWWLCYEYVRWPRGSHSGKFTHCAWLWPNTQREMFFFFTRILVLLLLGYSARRALLKPRRQTKWTTAIHMQCSSSAHSAPVKMCVIGNISVYLSVRPNKVFSIGSFLLCRIW